MTKTLINMSTYQPYPNFNCIEKQTKDISTHTIRYKKKYVTMESSQWQVGWWIENVRNDLIN